MGANASTDAPSELLSSDYFGKWLNPQFPGHLTSRGSWSVPRLEWSKVMEPFPASAEKEEQDNCSNVTGTTALGSERDVADLDGETTLRCEDRSTTQDETPVKLVVFDFDETLTLASFFPRNARFERRTNPKQMQRCVKLSFEDADGQRIRRLDEMLSALATGPHGKPRALAVLTKNTKGIRPVLALLQAAGLDGHFQALWCVPSSRAASEQGACRAADGAWQLFSPEATAGSGKADVIHSVVEQPENWFPLCSDDARFRELRLDHVVLVDDCPENFVSSHTGRQVLRRCEVARYQVECPELGTMTWGGIGARSQADYDVLRSFIDTPWLFR